MNIDKDIKDLNKYISFSKKNENFSHNTDYEWHKELGEMIERTLSELEKKDKMINIMADLMAHKIGTRTHICQHMTCDKKVAKECKSCVIEWAENEVK